MTSLEDEEHVRHLRRCIFCCNIYERENDDDMGRRKEKKLGSSSSNTVGWLDVGRTKDNFKYLAIKVILPQVT